MLQVFVEIVLIYTILWFILAKINDCPRNNRGIACRHRKYECNS